MKINKPNIKHLMPIDTNNIVSGSHKFYASTIAGSVAIKNLIITGLRCSPNCKTCSGGSINQCLSCFITSDNT